METATTPPPKNRRAGRACLNCRARKVRCDVVESDPCSNCRWDRAQCVVPRNRQTRKIVFAQADHHSSEHHHHRRHRNRGPPKAVYITAAPTTTAPETFLDPSSPANLLPHYISSPRSDSPHLLAYLHSQSIFSLPPPALQALLLRSYLERAYDRMPLLDLASFIDVLTQPHPPLDPSSSSSSSSSKSSGTSSRRRSSSARRKKSLPLCLFYAVLLAGAGHVSREELRLVGGVEDKMAFRGDMARRAGVAFDAYADEDHDNDHNDDDDDDEDDEEAGEQEERYHHHHHHHHQHLVQIQTALLLAYSGVPSSRHKDAWHWMNTAASLALAAELHREPAGPGLTFGSSASTPAAAPAAGAGGVLGMTWATEQRQEQQEQQEQRAARARLRRRLWWCCFARDKILALGLRRPARLRAEDCNVAMMAPSDMECHVLVPARRMTAVLLGGGGGGRGRVGAGGGERQQQQRHDYSDDDYDDAGFMLGGCDYGEQVASAELCIEKTKLLVVVSRVLELEARRQNGHWPPGGDGLLSRSAELLEGDLRAWYQGLPASCRYQPLLQAADGNLTLGIAAMHDGTGFAITSAPATAFSPGSSSMCINARRHLLHMMYNTALYMLYQTQQYPSPPLAAATTASSSIPTLSPTPPGHLSSSSAFPPSYYSSYYPPSTSSITTEAAATTATTATTTTTTTTTATRRARILTTVRATTLLAAELCAYYDSTGSGGPCCLPPTALLSLLPALRTNAANIRNPASAGVRRVALAGLRVCLRVVASLRELFATTAGGGVGSGWPAGRRRTDWLDQQGGLAAGTGGGAKTAGAGAGKPETAVLLLLDMGPLDLENGVEEDLMRMNRRDSSDLEAVLGWRGLRGDPGELQEVPMAGDGRGERATTTAAAATTMWGDPGESMFGALAAGGESGPTPSVVGFQDDLDAMLGQWSGDDAASTGWSPLAENLLLAGMEDWP